VELLLLGNSKYFLHLKSTFANLAYWMGSVVARGEVESLKCQVNVCEIFVNDFNRRKLFAADSVKERTRDLINDLT